MTGIKERLSCPERFATYVRAFAADFLVMNRRFPLENMESNS